MTDSTDWSVVEYKQKRLYAGPTRLAREFAHHLARRVRGVIVVRPLRCDRAGRSNAPGAVLEEALA